MKGYSFWMKIGRKVAVIAISIAIPMGIILFIMLLEVIVKNIA